MILFLRLLLLHYAFGEKRAYAERWYVNEGDFDQAIPCEMAIDELATPIIHVEWFFQQADYRTGSLIGNERLLLKRNSSTMWYETSDHALGPNFELIIERNVMADDIGNYVCQLTGTRESYKSTITLVLLSPAESDQSEPFVELRDEFSFPLDYRAEIGVCKSGYARPAPQIYWVMLDMFGDVIEEYHPTSGHFSFNPLIVDQSDDFFYEGVEMKLMFEDGLQIKHHNKRFACVNEYFYAEDGAQRVKKEVSFLSKEHLVKIYHPVTELIVQVNGKSTIGSVQVLKDARLELRCIANGYPKPQFISTQGDLNNGAFVIEHYNRLTSQQNFSCSAWNQLNREMHPKKQPPRSFVTFEEIDLGSIAIQGEPQLVRGEDALFFCNAVTSLPPNMLHYEWSFERDRPSQLASYPVKTYEGFSFSVHKASRKNMGKLQCSVTALVNDNPIKFTSSPVHLYFDKNVDLRMGDPSLTPDGVDNVALAETTYQFMLIGVITGIVLITTIFTVSIIYFINRRRNASRSPPVPTTNVPTSPTASNRTETSYTSDPQVYLKINPSTHGGPSYSDDTAFSL